jgi:serine/threonine-protein kinase
MTSETSPSNVSAAAGPHSLSSSRTGTSTVLTPKDALHVQEAARTRVYVWLILGIVVSVSATFPFIEIDATIRWLTIVALAIVGPAAVVFAWVLRTDAGYTPQRAFAFGLTCAVAVQAGVYLFGPLSAISCGVALGIFLFAPAQPFREALTLYAVCALSLAALWLAVSMGWIPDVGLVPTRGVAPFTQIATLLLVEVVLTLSFLIGRTARATTLSAIEKHDRTVRVLAHRRELLKEARQELERALKSGGLGRYTDEPLGAYRVGAIIGRGGMGEVYEALDTRTNERVAIKLLRAHRASDPQQVERFLREAKVVKDLESRSICQVLEVNTDDAAVPFIAMERLHGQDLSDILRDKGKLPLRRVVRMTRQVCQGLEAAREAGVVHRDIKPRNLFLFEPKTGPSRWKILDFGVARLAGSTGTLTGDNVVGTPAYMAPEQASGGDITFRTDLFALGVVIYRALTGRPPFSGASTPETLFQVVHKNPPRPADHVSLPLDVELVLAIALAKAPSDRLGGASELAIALGRAAEGELDERLRAHGREQAVRHGWLERTEAGTNVRSRSDGHP